MVKFYFSLFIFLSFQIFGQSFPGLNASTGNDYEYPVDKDTSIFMFQGNRLSKVDKNFNTIWSNTYSGISFTNLLLSKTGSIYFIAASGNSKVFFGKLNSTGGVIWVKTIQNIMANSSGPVYTGNGNCMSLLLDGANDLLISGNMTGIPSGTASCSSYILKCDTNGTPLKFKPFKLDYGQDLTIINDSSGVYRLLGGGPVLSATAFCIHSYSDASDNFTKFRFLWSSCGSGPSYANWTFYRSKLDTKQAYLFAKITNSVTDYNGVSKFTDNGQVKWNAQVHSTALNPYQAFGSMEEDNKGNILASISCNASCTNYSSAFIKIDSNGVKNAFLSKMLNGYYIPYTLPPQIPNHRPRVIRDNNYYFDIWGFNFPTNPVTIQRFNSSLPLPCGPTITATSNCFNIYPFSMGPSAAPATLIPVSSFTLNNYSVTTTPSTFSTSMNFCTILNSNEIVNDNNLLVYPNPAENSIHIEGSGIIEIELYDVAGKEVLKKAGKGEIDISGLSKGIYFITVVTKEGKYNKKIIKN